MKSTKTNCVRQQIMAFVSRLNGSDAQSAEIREVLTELSVLDKDPIEARHLAACAVLVVYHREIPREDWDLCRLAGQIALAA